MVDEWIVVVDDVMMWMWMMKDGRMRMEAQYKIQYKNSILFHSILSSAD